MCLKVSSVCRTTKSCFVPSQTAPPAFSYPIQCPKVSLYPNFTFQHYNASLLNGEYAQVVLTWGWKECLEDKDKSASVLIPLCWVSHFKLLLDEDQLESTIVNSRSLMIIDSDKELFGGRIWKDIWLWPDFSHAWFPLASAISISDFNNIFADFFALSIDCCRLSKCFFLTH